MRRFLSTSACVLVLAAAVRAQSAGAGSISGKVVDATTGAPLHRARVAIHLDGPKNTWGMAPTDSDGRFVLRALPAGSYRIEVSRRGYGNMAYGGHRPNGPGRQIELAAGQKITDVTFRLPRLGVITGTVTGADGEPLAGANIQALRRQFARGKLGWAAWRWAQTDDKGYFRLYGIWPGRYLVSANKQFEMIPGPSTGDPESDQYNRLGYATTYAPGTPLRHDAREIVVEPGQTVDNVEFAMLVIRPIKLGVQAQLPVAIPAPEPAEASPDAPPPPPRPQSQVMININLRDAPDSSDAQINWGGGLAPGGRFEYSNLQPGKYVLSGQVEIEGRMYVARQEVDLSGGESEVTLQFAPAIELHGALRLERAGGFVAAGRTVFLVSGDPRFPQPGARAQVQSDGSFTLQDVPPGLWDIGVEPLPDGGYIKSMVLGEEDVLRKDMVLTGATNARLDILVGAVGAELVGQVEGGKATTVLLAPQGENASVLSFYGVSGVDSKGAYRFHGMTPGVYKMYAFDDMEEGAWMDPNFLKPLADQGTLVELKEGLNEKVTPQVIHNAGAGAEE